MLHSHHSGDERGSLLRSELIAPSELWPLMEWCRAAPPSFSTRAAWRAAGGFVPGGPRFEAVAAVLAALESSGFCVRLRRA